MPALALFFRVGIEDFRVANIVGIHGVKVRLLMSYRKFGNFAYHVIQLLTDTKSG